MHTAQLRREQQLHELLMLGLPLQRWGRSGHWTIGPLHIFTGAGRWINERTGWSGRLNSRSMAWLINREKMFGASGRGETTGSGDQRM